MYLAWRDLMKNKLKFSLVVTIMVLIVYLVMFIISLALGLQNLAASHIKNSPAQTYIMAKGANASLENSKMTQEEAQKVLELLNDDTKAYVLYEKLANVTKEGSAADDEKIGVSFMSVPQDASLYPTVLEGRLPNNNQEVLASRYIQQKGVALGDTIEDEETGESFTIVGFSEPVTYNYSPIIFVTEVQFDKIKRAIPPQQEASVQAIVSDSVVEAQSLATLSDTVAVYSQQEVVLATPGFKAQNATFLLMIIFMYVISAMIVAVFFYVMTIQKIREYGQLKAIGASNGYLASSLLVQVVLVMGIGVVLSFGLIVATGYVLPDVVPFNLQMPYLLGGSVIFIVMALVGAVISLIKVMKVDAIEAIGGNN